MITLFSYKFKVVFMSYLEEFCSKVDKSKQREEVKGARWGVVHVSTLMFRSILAQSTSWGIKAYLIPTKIMSTYR